MRNKLKLIEPVPIDDDLCAGVALIEDADVGARFVLFARRTCYETGTVEAVVKRKIIVPVASICPAIELALHYLVRHGLPIPDPPPLRLVR